ncbi:MAG: hypothetical protein Q4P72_00990 [Eubacteriales bacterium]|nr:hypothetical protein [Eubacteriales bacterium]
MRKKLKLYALNPLLAGLLLLGTLGLDIDAKDGLYSKDQKRIKLEFSAETNEADPKANDALDEGRSHLTFRCSIDKDLSDLLLEGKAEVKYAIEENDGRLIFREERGSEEETEATEASANDAEAENADAAESPERNLIAKVEIHHGIDNDALTPSVEGEETKTVDQAVLIEVEAELTKNESPLWHRLNERKTSYFEAKLDQDLFILDLLPDEGLNLKQVNDADVFVLLSFNEDQLVLQIETALGLKSALDGSTDHLARSGNPGYLPNLQINHPNHSTPAASSTEKCSDTGAKATNDQAPNLPPTLGSKSVPSSEQQNPGLSPQSPVTSAPAPQATPAPQPEPQPQKSYLDLAHEAGYYESLSCHIFPTYDQAIAFGQAKMQARRDESAYANTLTPEEYANYQEKNFMEVNGFTSYGCFNFGDFALCTFE